MKRKLTALILSAAMLTGLCGCGSVFDKEYVSVSDYNPPAADKDTDEEKITVRNFSELKQTILKLVAAGETDSIIQFDQAYDGDTTEDMASACWQVRTQDAMCAYCVENIAYELTKIVTYYEASVHISYSEASLDEGGIVRLQYSTGLEELIRNAFETGDTKLVVLINWSTYSAEDMESIVGRTYRKYPASVPKEPRASVYMFSGTGMQRLYEINISYGCTQAELEARRKEMAELEPFAALDTGHMDQAHKALEACRYLVENCGYTEDTQYNSAYAALIRGCANSEGTALAYVELCRRLGVNCRIVYGQRDWQDYCWNIIEVDGMFYHVDVPRCTENGLENGFMLRDEDMWESHRWDVSSYPACVGDLINTEIIG